MTDFVFKWQIKKYVVCSGWNRVHISDIFNCYSGNINEMWDARKLGGIYKTFEFMLTYKKNTCVGLG